MHIHKGQVNPDTEQPRGFNTKPTQTEKSCTLVHNLHNIPHYLVCKTLWCTALWSLMLVTPLSPYHLGICKTARQSQPALAST